MDVSTDKTVTVPVTVKNNPGFAVGGFNVEYDTTALTFTSAELVADFANVSTDKRTPGNIGVFVERDKNYTEDGVLLNLKFTVTDSAQNGEYSVKLVQNDMYEFINWDTVTTITNVNFVSGSVTVSGVAAQPKVTSLKLMRTTTNDELTGKEFTLTLYSISGSYSSSIRAEFEAEEGADTTVTWKISDESVATVENKVNNGKNFCRITPKGLGTATLTAYCGDLTASLELTLAGPVATELKIKTSADKGYKTFYLHSTDTEAPTEQMKATTSNALSVVKDITWSSSNEDVLKVDANTGLVTVTGLGTSTITAQGTNAKGEAIKGSMSIDVQVDRSELPTITVKRGGETISAKSTSEIPTELYIPINQSLTVTTEIDKTSFTWMGKEYPYVITATRDYSYSKTGARITQQADGTWLIEKERSSETGKLVYFDFRTTIGGYLKSCYIKLKFTNETNLTQAADGYYQIYTAADLKEFADLVNNTVCTDKIGGRPEKNFNLRLMADIDMTPINDTYIPIGSAVDGTYGQYQSWGYYRWTGDFDGNNHKIYNVDITVKKPAKVSPDFGWGVLVTSGGSIHDLTVDGKVKADSSWTDWFSGVGEASTYKNVTSNLDIDAGNARFVAGIGSKASMCTFENCVNNGNITGNGNVYGIGSRALNVTCCVNNGKLVSTGEKASVVGIVDQTRSNGNTTNIAVSECANFGELVSAGSAAGIIGEATPGATGYIKDCYNMGSITGVTAAGGIVGTLYMNSSGNLLTMNNCYNYGAISATGTDAAKGEIIANMNYGWNKADIAITNCYYNEASGNSGIGAVKNDDNITYTEPVFTAIPQVEFATLADKLGDNFQSSCPAPVFTWQQAKAHDYGADISYNWHLNSETGVYDACTASVTCTECGSPLTQALTVKRDVARTDCTQERTVTYTATGTINGLAASDTMTDILPAGTHEVNSAKWASDGDAHWHVCANCNVRVDETAHTNNGWKTDANNHWHECTVCGSSYDLDKHSGGTATAVKKAQCKACGQEYGELALPTQDKDGYYLIHNADELLWFRNTVNAGQNTIKGRLANDIDMTGACTDWTPIGSYSKPFIGAFDGAGWTISNFILQADALPGGDNVANMGLFGAVSVRDGSKIDIGNFTLSGSITANTSKSAYNVAGVCAIVPDGSAYFHDITVDMDINAPGVQYVGGVLGGMSTWGSVTIKNCHNLGDITGKSRVGGIAGYIRQNGSVSDCTNIGAITGATTSDGYKYSYAGGIVGYLGENAMIIRCLNQGVVSGVGYVGGIAGVLSGDDGWHYQDSDVISCANEGNVKATGEYVGGLVGQLWSGIIWNGYNTADVTGGQYVGGIFGGSYLWTGKYSHFKNNSYGVPKDPDVEDYNAVKNVYNLGTVTGSTDVGAIAGRVMGKGAFTNAFYADASAAPFGSIPSDIEAKNKVVEPMSLNSVNYLTERLASYENFATEKFFFQASCPYPVLEWQDAQEHILGSVTFDWTQDPATGIYTACVAKKSCENCEYAITAKLSVTRTVIREATTERTGSVLYTAVGYLGDEAVKDDILVTLPVLTGPQVTALTLNKSAETVIIGKDAQEFADILFATVTAEEGADTTVYWASSDTDMATVASASGDSHKCVITAKAAGTVTITASCGSKVATFQLTVQRNASELSVVDAQGNTSSTVTISESDTAAPTVQLYPVFNPADATPNLTWTSENEDVAVVDSKGKVTVTGLGQANIIVKQVNPDGSELSSAYILNVRTLISPTISIIWDGSDITASSTSAAKRNPLTLSGGDAAYVTINVSPATFKWLGKTLQMPQPVVSEYLEYMVKSEWVTDGEHAGQVKLTNRQPYRNSGKMAMKVELPGYGTYKYFGVNMVEGTYTVNFDANGGEGAMTSQTLTYGKTSESLKANAFTKPGYTFAGWNTAADGTGTAYTNRQTTPNVTTENGGAVTLYAQWTANSYTVKFDGNGAEGTMADQSFTYDVEQALTANGFTKTGYTFAGWKLDDTTYEDGATVKNLATSGEITLIAQWTAIKKDDGASTGDSGIIAWGAAMPVAVLAAAYVIGRKKREE